MEQYKGKITGLRAGRVYYLEFAYKDARTVSWLKSEDIYVNFIICAEELRTHFLAWKSTQNATLNSQKTVTVCDRIEEADENQKITIENVGVVV